MGIQAKQDKEVKIEPKAISYKAKAILLKRIAENDWKEEEVILEGKNSFIELLGEEEGITQVNLSTEKKVFYNTKDITDEIYSKVKDMTEETYYMASPLIISECDSEKPIDISKEVKEEIKSAIEFY